MATSGVIGQTFNVVRDAIANPQMLEEIPNGPMLRFRDVPLEGQQICLTAYLPKKPDARRDARGSGPVIDAIPQHVPETRHLPPWVQSERDPSVAGYDTAEAALDALEVEIGASEQVEPAIRRAVGASLPAKKVITRRDLALACVRPTAGGHHAVRPGPLRLSGGGSAAV